MSRTRASRPSHRTRAFLLRRTEHGEADLVLALFTESLGRIPALGRGARRSQKRFGGALEPFHTLLIDVDEPGSGELFLLREATIATMRLTLTSDLARMDAAGRALSWVRTAAPPRHDEPGVWTVIERLMDRLDAAGAASPRQVLAEEGLRLLAAFGWGLEMSRCVRCGRVCEPGRTAMVDADRGGLVCRACGGARFRLGGAARARVAAGALLPEDVDVTLDLVERALRAHVGVV
ncbi:MAG TPA: DNA repair protein RecO [Polyangiaceae bacterium]|nr:DNA repair protein RecO [Polyangiaceae bacterium]